MRSSAVFGTACFLLMFAIYFGGNVVCERLDDSKAVHAVADTLAGKEDRAHSVAEWRKNPGEPKWLMLAPSIKAPKVVVDEKTGLPLPAAGIEFAWLEECGAAPPWNFYNHANNVARHVDDRVTGDQFFAINDPWYSDGQWWIRVLRKVTAEVSVYEREEGDDGKRLAIEISPPSDIRPSRWKSDGRLVKYWQAETRRLVEIAPLGFVSIVDAEVYQ